MAGYAKDGRYFKFGGEPYNWMANWRGLPPPANNRGGRELGDATSTFSYIQTGDIGPLGLSQKEMIAAGAVIGVAALLYFRKKRRR